MILESTEQRSLNTVVDRITETWDVPESKTVEGEPKLSRVGSVWLKKERESTRTCERRSFSIPPTPFSRMRPLTHTKPAPSFLQALNQSMMCILQATTHQAVTLHCGISEPVQAHGQLDSLICNN